MVEIIVGIVFTKFKGLKPFERKIIDKCTSYHVKGSEFSKLYRKGAWDGKVHLLNFRNTVPSGMLDIVLQKFKKHNISFKLKDTRKHFKIADASFPPNVSRKMRLARAYQAEAVSAIFKNRIGIINLPTGTGKTYIMAMTIAILRKQKFVVLASGTSLLLQLRDEISDLIGEEVGYIGEGKWEERRVTVSSIDTLSSMLLPPPKKVRFLSDKEKQRYFEKINRWKELQPKAVRFLAKANAICLDEAHHSPSKTFKAVLYACTNATLRCGFTATFMRSGGDEMLLQATTGGVIYKKTISWMVKNGYLAKPLILVFPFDPDEFSECEFDGYRDAYKSGIVENIYRNRLLIKIIEILYKFKLRTVVFVKEIAHGEVLQAMLENGGNTHNARIVFATGDESGSVRRRLLAAFRAGKIRVLICTRIFNEGIDFPEASVGIKADGMKYEGMQLQQLGRILRKVPTASGEIDVRKREEVLFIDIVDMFDEYLLKHAKQRLSTYEKEKAFKIKVVKSSNEFKKYVKKHINRMITI